MVSRLKVIKYMLDNYKDHMDWSCNCLNTTTLAEDACDTFEQNIYDVPEEYFEWAAETEDILIKKDLINA